MYNEYFEESLEENTAPLGGDVIPTLHLSSAVEGDLGMEVEEKLNPEVLSNRIGFRNGLAHQFNRHRHKAGLSIWDYPPLFREIGSEDPNFSPLRLHWHQLAGVHSVARNIFSQTPRQPHFTGMLIADEVGLGKTLLALSIIGFLNQVFSLQERKLDLPPVLRK